MGTSRIEIFRQMLANDPANTSVLFGLAKEFEKAGRYDEMVETLLRYLELTDDEGNAYGMLATAYERLDKPDEAKAAYERGIETAQRHGHPGMAEEYRAALAGNYEH
jgi:tetratricopeptide (TPR) repeat protein